MTDTTVRLIQNLRATLAVANAETLYYLVRILADELQLRELPAQLEARALQLALYPAALALHQERCAAEDSHELP